MRAADAPPVCVPVLLDLDRPVPDIRTQGARSLFVTSTYAGRPLGSCLVPVAGASVPASVVVAEVERNFGWMLEKVVAEESVRRLDESPARELPGVSVVVCTRDRPDQLRRCLASLADFRPPVVEVVVVDNADEPDADVELAAAAIGARYVHEPVAGHSRARNRGLMTATGEVVAFTDDDVEVHPAWAERLAQQFTDPLVMAATGLVLPRSLATTAQLRFERQAGFSRGMNRVVFDGTARAPYRAPAIGAGASLAIRLSFLRDLGGFPEELGGGLPTGSGDDHAVLGEVLAGGYRAVYEPSALAFHMHRADDEAFARVLRTYGLGTVAMVLHLGVRRRDVGALVGGVLHTLRYHCVRAAKTVRHRPGSLEPHLLMKEIEGLAAGPASYVRARRIVADRPPIDAPVRPRGPIETSERKEPSTATQAPVRVQAELPTMSLVIPSRGRRDMLVSLLRGLDGQQYAEGGFEVIVVVDGDIDGSRAAIENRSFRWPVTTVVLDPRGSSSTHGSGAGVARNHGALAARNEVLLFLDDDVDLAHDGVLAAHGAAHDDRSTVAVGPCPPDVGGTSGFFAQQIRNWGVDYLSYLRNERPLGFSAVATGNLSMPASLFHSVGGFRAMPRREDWELGYRLIGANAAVRLVEEGAVVHGADVDLGHAIEDRRREGAGDVDFALEHPEMFAWLPLAHFDDFSPRRRRILRAVLRNPSWSGGPLRAAVTAAEAAEAAGAREHFSRVVGSASVVAYWAGVGDAVGLSGWERLRSEARAVRQPVHELDLSDDTWTPPQAGTASHVRITSGGHQIGVAPVRWGRVPWKRHHFLAAVANHFAPALARAATRTPA